ncbi:uncharacterized protein [Rutidosis leptorrhynchoides]|uniref:uncharacterized protein n=1 Tax=Rutidosis leptorrhynchoides TaxID=125765 RepID=UPI003A98E9E8
MWCALDNIIQKIESAWVVCGDFNEVRCHEDRLNSVFHPARASRFNEFILKNNLIEIPLLGKRFTRISDDGLKFSKLDRFLVNDKFAGLWVDLSVVPIDCRESDHCPIMLRDRVINFGPKPFKLFDEWFNKEGVDKVIMEAWAKPVSSSRKDCIFRDRLKNVKNEIKIWSKREFGNLEGEIIELKKCVAMLEDLAESGKISDEERARWLENRRRWVEKEKN